MLFIDTNIWEVILIAVTSIVGMFGVSVALEGYLLSNLKWPFRIIVAAGGLLLIIPGIVTDVVGLSLVAVVVIVQLIERKKASQLA